MIHFIAREMASLVVTYPDGPSICNTEFFRSESRRVELRILTEVMHHLVIYVKLCVGFDIKNMQPFFFSENMFAGASYAPI
jgi:hypothetical protein